MRVVMAPDSFKGSLEATAVAKALTLGWREVRPQDQVQACPMADGGEGTLEAFAAAHPAALRMPVVVTGPEDQPVPALVLLLEDGAAVVELALTSGISLTSGRRAVHAHTRGFGQAIAAALDAGARRLVLAVGGSGTTDGGAGMLRELGARFLDSHGRDIGDGGGALAHLIQADLSMLRPLPPDGVDVLTDVTSPLLGPSGAAALFGPQKGAAAHDVERLEDALARYAEVLGTPAEAPGAGAAGGTGYGLIAWGARLVPGAEGVATAVDLPQAVADADVVVTGEGRFDGQTSYGKAPMYVLGLADSCGTPTCLVAGIVDAPTNRFAASVSLTELAGSAQASLADPQLYCEEAGRRLARLVIDRGS